MIDEHSQEFDLPWQKLATRISLVNLKISLGCNSVMSGSTRTKNTSQPTSTEQTWRLDTNTHYLVLLFLQLLSLLFDQLLLLLLLFQGETALHYIAQLPPNEERKVNKRLFLFFFKHSESMYGLQQSILKRNFFFCHFWFNFWLCRFWNAEPMYFLLSVNLKSDFCLFLLFISGDNISMHRPVLNVTKGWCIFPNIILQLPDNSFIYIVTLYICHIIY